VPYFDAGDGAVHEVTCTSIVSPNGVLGAGGTIHRRGDEVPSYTVRDSRACGATAEVPEVPEVVGRIVGGVEISKVFTTRHAASIPVWSSFWSSFLRTLIFPPSL